MRKGGREVGQRLEYQRKKRGGEEEEERRQHKGVRVVRVGGNRLGMAAYRELRERRVFYFIFIYLTDYFQDLNI